MTLCLAWTQNGRINIASDSRGGHTDEYIDTLIKVVDLPVRIEAPVEQNGEAEEVYKHTLGLCFTGRTFNSLVIRDHFMGTLRHLQYMPGMAEVSLANIVNFMAKIFIKISKELKKGYDADPESEFLIAGYCPLLGEVAAYYLQLYDGENEGEFEPVIDRVLLDQEEIFCMGSGGDRAMEIIEESDFTTSAELLGVLRSICHDPDQLDVGGHMQLGLFIENKDKDFVLRGIQDYEINEQDELSYVYTYRGLEMHRGEFEVDETELQIRMKYFCPFQKEIDAYFDRKTRD